jgi:hypothetical protein
VKERPITLSGDEVRAIMDGRKTQLRRVVKSPHAQEADAWAFDAEKGLWESGIYGGDGRYGHGEYVRCPFGQPGDRLWVKETWLDIEDAGTGFKEPRYVADFPEGVPSYMGRASSPVTMPRWASRITLEIVNVRVERLQDISKEDAISEGATFTDYGLQCYHDPAQPCSLFTHNQKNGWSMRQSSSSAECMYSPKYAYANWWESRSGFAKRAPWSSNPWVWVVEFRRVEQVARAA